MSAPDKTGAKSAARPAIRNAASRKLVAKSASHNLCAVANDNVATGKVMKVVGRYW